MTILDDKYPEVRDLHSLYWRMGHRLPASTFASHCRTAAISMYGLHGSNNGSLKTKGGAQVLLRVAVDGHLWPWPTVARRYRNGKPTGKTLLVLDWRPGTGLVELVNGSRSMPEPGMGPFIRHRLDIEPDESEKPIEVLEPDQPRDYVDTPVSDRGAADQPGNGGAGAGRGDGRGDGPNGPDGPDGPDDGGGGGLVEVLSHPVLFSTDPDYYRSLLENY